MVLTDLNVSMEILGLKREVGQWKVQVAVKKGGNAKYKESLRIDLWGICNICINL